MIDPGAHTYNLEVERSVLAVVLDGRHLTAWDTLLEHIATPMAFYEQIHRRVFVACQALAAEGAGIDCQAVCEVLAAMRFAALCETLREAEGLPKTKHLPAREDGLNYEDSALAACGGINPISDLAGLFSPAAGLERNCKILSAHYRQRMALEALTKGVDRLRRPGGVREVEAIVNDTIDGCLAQTKVGGSGFISAKEALAGHDAVQAGGSKPRAACFGITALDDAVTIRAGELWTLAANTGCGKTSLLLHALTATSEMLGPCSVAMVSQEMGRKELGEIYVARRLKIARKMVSDGMLTVGQREMGEEVNAWLDPMRIAIRDGGSANVNDVVSWAQSRKRVNPSLSLLAIDYLGLLRATSPRQSDYEKLSEATRTLKQAAREMGIAVLLLAQMSNEARKVERNKDGTLKRPPEPQTTDLKGSGSIGDDSDGVMFLWRPTDDATLIEAKVTKCRADAPPRIALRWTPWEGQRFSDPNPPEPTHSTGRTRHDRMNNPTDTNPF